MLKTVFEKLFQAREEASRLRPGADAGYDAHEKPFLDHLEDLRHTLMKIGATLAVATVLAFAFHRQIFALIQLPAKMPMARISDGVTLWDRLDLITLSPPEFIILMLKLSFFSGVIVTFPFILYFLFQFILPGLRQVEKKAVVPGAAVGFALFLVGVSFAFFLAAPVALKFFYVFENQRISNLDPSARALEKPIQELTLVGVEGERYGPAGEETESGSGDPPSAQGEKDAGATESSLSPEMRQEIHDYIRNSFATLDSSNFALRYDDARKKLVIVESKGGRSIYRIGEYIGFIARLVLVFGISFQLPVVVSILVKLELLTARVMRATRTYAWIIILVASAILTPPDLITLSMLGGPMVILYEICILIASLIERRREKRERAEEEERRSRLEQLYSKRPEDLSEEEKQEMHRAEIEQYEREHAHLFESDDPHHGDEHDEGWYDDEGDWHEDHGDDEDWHDDRNDWPEDHEHDEHDEHHEPVQDWPDRPDEGMESDHAEPVDLEPGGEGSTEEAEERPRDEDTQEDEDQLRDEQSCEPDGPVVDVNHADLEQLLTLPGVGPKLAATILEHRPFETFNELERVPGLGEKKLAGMIDRLMLG